MSLRFDSPPSGRYGWIEVFEDDEEGGIIVRSDGPRLVDFRCVRLNTRPGATVPNPFIVDGPCLMDDRS
jgi:hypothetical protein